MAAIVARSIGLLGACLAVVAMTAGGLLAGRYGAEAWQASVLAAGIVWGVGAASLVLIGSARTREMRINCVLLGMLARLSLPLIAVLYFEAVGGRLAAAGIITFITIHYLAGLIVETVLSIRLVALADRAITPPAASGRLA